MKKLLRPLQLSLIAITVILAVGCNNDDDSDNGGMEELTIYDTAVAAGNLNTLVAALEATGLDAALDAPGTYTVFAPTDDAFTAAGITSLDAFTTEELTNFLLNHVLAFEVRSGELATDYASTLASGPGETAISLFVNTNGGVELNGVASPIASGLDIEASNGVVHLIDAPLPVPTIVDHALANPEFSILVEAVTRPSFGDTFTALLSDAEGAAPFTVFAPTNQAFQNLLAELGANSLDDIDDATLSSVLTYHVITMANVVSSDLTNETVAETANGASLGFNVDNGAQVIDGTDTNANVILADVQAGNGVIHAIDKVLLPPAGE